MNLKNICCSRICFENYHISKNKLEALRVTIFLIFEIKNHIGLQSADFMVREFQYGLTLLLGGETIRRP